MTVREYQVIDAVLKKLSKSSFRSSFKLKEQDKEYLKLKGHELIRSHANDFIAKRLAPSKILNDGKQTPMQGHPIFIAQHATATCCRSCLYKWHHIDKNKELSSLEQKYIVDVIMEWLKRQFNN